MISVVMFLTYHWSVIVEGPIEALEALKPFYGPPYFSLFSSMLRFSPTNTPTGLQPPELLAVMV